MAWSGPAPAPPQPPSADLRDAGLVHAPTELTILQGHDMGRPSTIRVAIPTDRAGIDVTGGAVPMP